MSEIPESDRLGDLPHPRETVDLVGHAAEEQALLGAYLAGRMPHAWLLTGPRGVGKATLAYRIARFVLANPVQPPDPGSLSVSEDHPVFRQVAALGHPNLLVLRRPWDEKAKRLKTAIPVDEVRRTSGFFGLSAGAGGWRVCIVDATDEMNANAANALLKVLEEPPPKSLFLLVSHEPGRLLPTIVSRCRRLALKPLSTEEVAEVLARHETDLGADQARQVALLAEGSAGRALMLASGGGLELYTEMTGLLRRLPDLDVPAVHVLADRLARRGADDAYRMFRDLLDDWLTRLIRTGATGETGPDILPGEGEAIRGLAARASLDRWIEVWENVSRSQARADALNMDRKQVILSGFEAIEAVAAGAPMRMRA